MDKLQRKNPFCPLGKKPTLRLVSAMEVLFAMRSLTLPLPDTIPFRHCGLFPQIQPPPCNRDISGSLRLTIARVATSQTYRLPLEGRSQAQRRVIRWGERRLMDERIVSWKPCPPHRSVCALTRLPVACLPAFCFRGEAVAKTARPPLPRLNSGLCENAHGCADGVITSFA